MQPQVRLFGTLLGLLVSAGSAGAQVLQVPARGLRSVFGGSAPADPNRTHQELELQGNLLGGYDDNLSPTGGAGEIFTARPSGYVGFADLGARYLIGNQKHSLEANGRGFLNSFTNVGVGTTFGGNQNLLLRTSLGRKTQLQVNESLNFLPYFTLGLFGPVTTSQSTSASTESIPVSSSTDINPTNSLSEARSFIADVVATVSRDLNRRTRIDGGYAFRKISYETGAAYDSTENDGWLGFNRGLTRTTNLHVGYRHSDNQIEEFVGVSRPIRNDSIDGGFEYTRNLSRTRRMAFSGGGGAVRFDTVDSIVGVPFTYWSPTAYGTARVDLNRTWSLSGDYRRAQTLLQGVVARSFIAHSALVTVGGLLSSRIESVISAGYSNGQTGQSANLLAVGQYDGYTAAAQVRFMLMRGWSAIVGYNHYQYLLNEAARRALQVEPEMQRNSVRVGLTWSLPLYGRSSGTPMAPIPIQ